MAYLNFGKQFRAWRERNNVSAYRIAQVIGCHPSFLSNVEAGRRPMSDEVMRKIARSKEFPIAYKTLRAWQALSMFSRDELKKAVEV